MSKAKLTVEEADIKLVLLPKDTIKADQDAIRLKLVGLDQSVHNNAVQCLMHAEKHGDTSLMRRLIIEVLGTRTAATGYRTQGLINWMRKHSPMELKGDTINLTGTDGHGNKRPFLIEKAQNTPFWSDPDNAERVAKPVFQDTLFSPVNRSIKAFYQAIENTVNGKPVDPTKPYYDGIHSDKVVDIMSKMKALVAELPADDTREVRVIQLRHQQDAEFLKANTHLLRPEQGPVANVEEAKQEGEPLADAKNVA
jgi:hypothetical protein